MGSGLSTLSRGVKSITAAICVMLARIASWLSTTPLGRASEPDVNTTTAGPLLRPGVITRRGLRSARIISQSLSPSVSWERMSSKYNNCRSAIPDTTVVNRACSMKAREVMTVRTRAAVQALCTAIGPAV